MGTSTVAHSEPTTKAPGQRPMAPPNGAQKWHRSPSPPARENFRTGAHLRRRMCRTFRRSLHERRCLARWPASSRPQRTNYVKGHDSSRSRSLYSKLDSAGNQGASRPKSFAHCRSPPARRAWRCSFYPQKRTTERRAEGRGCAGRFAPGQIRGGGTHANTQQSVVLAVESDPRSGGVDAQHARAGRATP